MSSAQLDMLERLEELVDYYLKCEPVTLASLGRAGEKLAKLSAFCFDLFDASSHLDFEDISRFLNSLNNSFDAYSKPPESHNEFPAEPFASNAESDRDQPELVLPKVRVRGDTCVSLPVSASRIKWKLAPPSILALF